MYNSRRSSTFSVRLSLITTLTVLSIFAVCVQSVDFRTTSEHKLSKDKTSINLQSQKAGEQEPVAEERVSAAGNEIASDGWDLVGAADGGGKKSWSVKGLINKWGQKIRSKTKAVVGAPKYIASRYHKSVGKFLGLGGGGWGWTPPKKVKSTGWSKPKSSGWSKPKSSGWSQGKHPKGWSNSPIIWVDGKGEHTQSHNSYEYDPGSYGWSAENGYKY